jgi:16S rRNA U1498 N3-methylase RsmE
MIRIPGFIKRSPRVDLRRSVTLTNSDGTQFSAVILDLSGDGCRLEVSETPRIGERVTLRDDRGREFAAQIRWALGNEAGAAFLGPVSFSED